MARIIELTIVWHQCLDGERIRHVVGLDEGAVLCRKECVVFSNASIVIFLFPVNRDVAKEDDDALCRMDDVPAIRFTVAKKCCLFPSVAKEVPWYRQFWKDEDSRA